MKTENTESRKNCHAQPAVTHIKALYTDKMAHHAIHGRAVNYLQGVGKNVANDLKQEYFVKKNKK